MSYHSEVVVRAQQSLSSFIEIQCGNTPPFYLNIEGLSVSQIVNSIKNLGKITKVGLVSNSKVNDSEESCKLVTTYSDNEKITCSIIYGNNTIAKVAYISNTIVDRLIEEDKKHNTLH